MKNQFSLGEKTKEYINTYMCLNAWKFFVRIQSLLKEDEEGEKGGYMSFGSNFLNHEYMLALSF